MSWLARYLVKSKIIGSTVIKKTIFGQILCSLTMTAFGNQSKINQITLHGLIFYPQAAVCDALVSINTINNITLIVQYHWNLNRYRRERPKVDASIFDSALSQSHRSDALEKEKKIVCPLLDVFPCGQVSSPRLNRLL